MKLKKYFSFALAALLSVGFFASFSDDDNNDHKDTNPLPNNFYVLNRGNFNANNASVAFFDAATQDMEGKWYQDANAGSGLGDSAEDMIIFNNHVYVTVYGSNRLAMMDMNGKLVNSLEPVVNESPASPRSLVAYNNKLYVSYYSAHAVAVINPTNLSVEKMIPVGRYPEQLTVAGGKLYVANSGGMDYPVYGNTISVVDLSSETVVSEIEVAFNPCRLASSTSGDVWVVSMGN